MLMLYIYIEGCNHSRTVEGRQQDHARDSDSSFFRKPPAVRGRRNPFHRIVTVGETSDRAESLYG